MSLSVSNKTNSPKAVFNQLGKVSEILLILRVQLGGISDKNPLLVEWLKNMANTNLAAASTLLKCFEAKKSPSLQEVQKTITPLLTEYSKMAEKALSIDSAIESFYIKALMSVMDVLKSQAQ